MSTSELIFRKSLNKARYCFKTDYVISFTGGMCKAGTFCPPGSDAPTPCTPGYYCSEDALNNTKGLCAPGYYCNGSTIDERPVNKSYGDICPPGHFCELGSNAPNACRPGEFARGYGNDYRNACIPCKCYHVLLLFRPCLSQ